jgi:hypothetical protein
MRKFGTAAAYLIATVALSLFSLTYEWPSPLRTPEGDWDWYSEAGLRTGFLVFGHHAPPGGGWIFGVHVPKLGSLPFYAGAGPESGGAYVSLWVVVLSVAALHAAIRWKRRS